MRTIVAQFESCDLKTTEKSIKFTKENFLRNHIFRSLGGSEQKEEHTTVELQTGKDSGIDLPIFSRNSNTSSESISNFVTFCSS